jgi:DNA-binding MarR family transcriptional regulator
VLLTALWRQDGMTVGELAGYYRKSDMVLTRILDRMVEAGLIERKPDSNDRRVVRVFLTGKAVELSHLLDFYKSINSALLKGFSEEEQATLFELLERVIVNSREALMTELSEIPDTEAQSD